MEEQLHTLGVDEGEWGRLLSHWDAHTWHDGERLSEKTNVLMVDASLVTVDGKPDLDALHTFLKDHVVASVSDLDLVSLFPYAVKPSDTAVDPRVRLYEDLGRFADDFGLMYEWHPDAYNDQQFDVLGETNALLARLAHGATKLLVHLQSFKGLTEDRVHATLALWRDVIHRYKPNAKLMLSDGLSQDALDRYADDVDVLCQFDLASHVLLAFIQGDVTRLTGWARQMSEDKTYFNFLSSVERDPFEKNLLHAGTDELLAAHSILLSLKGIPALDYRTLFGVTTPTDHETLVHELKQPARLDVYAGIVSQLNVKRTQAALSPHATQHILEVDKRLFGVERATASTRLRLYTNVSAEDVPLSVQGTNVFTGEPVDGTMLAPYGFLWLET